MQSLSRNGVAHGGLALPHGALAFPAPRAGGALDAVLDLQRGAGRIITYALLGAFFLHAAAVIRAEIIPIEMMNWAHGIGREVHYRLFETYEVDLLKPPETKLPPPKEEPPPEKEEPKPPPPPMRMKEEPPAAAPAAAKAGAVLTAPANPDEPANFDGFINGTGETYAGGNTMANGTSDTAVRARPAASGGVPGGTGTAPTGPAVSVDKSRPAAVSGSTDWNCPFPPEADSEQIDQAFPTIQVAVAADGSPTHVTILSDPGHGFGRAAVRCAMQQHFSTALDHDGNPIAGMTKSVRVRFER
jgi:periplasmic protein TonB